MQCLNYVVITLKCNYCMMCYDNGIEKPPVLTSHDYQHLSYTFYDFCMKVLD